FGPFRRAAGRRSAARPRCGNAAGRQCGGRLLPFRLRVHGCHAQSPVRELIMGKQRTTGSMHGFRHQRGAALYVALIFLVVLALLGIGGMQVALLQERMAANYRATNEAFQRSEAVARAIEGDLNAPNARFVPDSAEREQERRCDDPAPVRGSSWADLRSIEDDPDTAVVV